METTNTPSEKSNDSVLTRIILFILSLIVTLPVFIYLHRLLPDPDWAYNLDRMLLFGGLFTIIEMLFRLFRKIVLWVLLVVLIRLTYGTLTSGVGFAEVYNQYKYMLYSLANSPNPKNLLVAGKKNFSFESKIKQAIDFQHPDVRNFALSTVRKHFLDHQQHSPNSMKTIIQAFAIFKEINQKWNYVHDPKGMEYFAKASESIQHLSGDCDDHSILMAACIKAIGGTPRLILTHGHIYPELHVGHKRDMDEINYYIREVLFKRESQGKTIHFHIDQNGEAWINLDYTENYPGGDFMNQAILDVIYL